MKLRTRKRLLNSASVGCVLAAIGVLITAWTTGPPVLESPLKVNTPNAILSQTASLKPVVNPQIKQWQRPLRRPLYDPPPPKKVIVKKKPRPITFKLTGTVLEPNNSQAFLRLSNGTVALRKIGDQVTDDPRDGTIKEITASEIVIKREEDEVRVQVERQS